MNYLQSTDLSLIRIEASTFCNAKCPHCPRYTDDGYLHDYIPSAHLSLSALQNGLDPTKLINLKEVIIEGDRGDPFMNPDIISIIKFFDFVPLVKVYTNGSLRNTDFWQELAQIPNLLVMWSIDGLEDTNPLYRIGTDYRKIMNNVKSFIDAGGTAVWKCVVFRHNEHQIDSIKKQAAELKFKGTQFIKAYQYRFQGLATWPVYIEGQRLHDLEPTSMSEDQVYCLSSYRNAIYPKKNNLSCPWMNQETVYINALGQLIPCCMMVSETTNNYVGKDILQSMMGGTFDHISLYNYSLDKILYKRYGQKFEKTLQAVETMHPVCAKGCSSIIFNGADKFIGIAVSKTKAEEDALRTVT